MNNRFQGIILPIAVLVMAIVLGQWVVTDLKLAGIMLTASLAIGVLGLLKQHIWILIPTLGVASISFPWIPGDFSPAELASIYVIGCMPLLMVAGKFRLGMKMTAIEWMAILLVLCVLQAFLRNPTGIRMMDGEYVGGRAYFILAISFLAGIVLASTRTTHERVQQLYRWALLGYLGNLGIQLLSRLSVVPAVYLNALFGVSGAGNSAEISDNGRAGRNSAARTLAKVASLYLVSKRNPVRVLFNPYWLLILMSAVAGAGMSGFRNVIASVALTLLLGAYYWGRLRGLTIACILGMTCYLGLVVANVYYPLPGKMQRSLSFLPGTWDEDHIADAQSSTDWRTEMWEIALTTDTYIQNKLFGDGLGIRRSDWERMIELKNVGMVTNEMSQERAMLAGDFHSGPITTIRVIGCFGLIVFIVAQITVARRAHILIIRSKGKAHFREVIFFCLPMVYQPLFFIFVFGSFKTAAPMILIQMGLLRLFEINLGSAKLDNIEVSN